MRVITLVLAYLAVAMARPQFRLTEKEYEGFQAGLDGRIPVAITSGQLLYSAVDESPNNFVVVDFGGAGLGDPRIFESGVASFRSLETVTVPAADVVSVAASTPEPSTAAGIETTSSVADTTTAAVSAATSSAVTEAVSTSTSAVTVAAPEVAAAVPVADLRSASVVAEDTAVAPAAHEEAIVAPPATVTEAVPTSTVSTEAVTTSAVTEAVVASSTAVAEPIDDTLNEIVPAAPKAEENANAPVDIEKSAVVPATDLLSAPAAVEDVAAVPIAESRSAPVAAEDTALAPAAPEEAIVAPPATVAVGVALIRRKRQFVDAEEPISNAKKLGTGLGTASGLFGPLLR